MLIRLYQRELEIRDLHPLALIRRHPRLFNPSRQTHQLLARAELIGPNTLALCRELFEQRGREAQKSMWGIVGLGPRYPACILEQAAAVALARQIHSYKAVRAMAEQLLAQAVIDLDARQPQLPLTTITSPLTQQHELIRAPAEYAEFFNRISAANTSSSQKRLMTRATLTHQPGRLKPPTRNCQCLIDIYPPLNHHASGETRP